MGYFTILIPEYWKSDYSEEYRYRAYAETSGRVAMLAISCDYDEKDLVIITDAGMVMRMSLDQINVLGRVTQGVRLIKLKEENKVATVSLVDKEEEKEDLGNNPDEIQTDLGNNVAEESVALGNNLVEEATVQEDEITDDLDYIEEDSSEENSDEFDEEI